MVKIIRNLRGAAEAEQRLVAAMLNTEHAAAVFDDRGARAAGRAPPYPTIRVPPRTAEGLAVTYHLKPVVGVVFYTAGAGFNLGAFLARVHAALDRHGYGHLAPPRATAAPPSATLRQSLALEMVTALVGPRKPYSRASAGSAAGLPARMLLFTPLSQLGLPDQVSYRAAFTWVFMPVSAVIGVSVRDGRSLNALLASALYDDAGLTTLADGSTVHHLSAKDFEARPLPAPFAALPAAVGWHRSEGDPLAAAVAVISGRGGGRRLDVTLALPGETAGLTPSCAEVPWAALRPSRGEFPPPAPAAAGAAGASAPAPLACLLCSTPLWGEVYALRDPRRPGSANFQAALWANARIWGGELVPEGGSFLEGRDALLCRFCARGITAETAASLGCTLVRSRAPLSAEEALRGHRLEPLLAVARASHAIREVPELWGCFLVGTGPDAFVLAPITAPPHLTMSRPALSALPILRFRTIAEL